MAVTMQSGIKVLNSVPPAAINADTTSIDFTEVDTKGFDYANIFVSLGATDIAIGDMTVTEGDTSASGHADVTGLIFNTSTNTDGDTSTFPSATDDNKVFEFQIDLRYRKRYLDMTLAFADGTNGGYVSVLTVLSRADEPPFTSTERGVSQILRV